MLKKIRENLLQEAKYSPELLSDLAGLEEYIAESYSSRSFIELLQNADDAKAHNFLVKKTGNVLLVCNDGREFTSEDLEALCRSAASKKNRGETIGYRGIGFKSVVSFASIVHLISGELLTTFSREMTKIDIPQAVKVPLIRIPHPIDDKIYHLIHNDLHELRSEGFRTIFVFDQTIAMTMETEFSSFDPTCLLFLKNIQRIEFRGEKQDNYQVFRTGKGEKDKIENVTLHEREKTSKWIVHHFKGIALAFATDKNGIIRLNEQDSIVHAFLPTKEQSGFGCKINGDISTDPSRSNIVLDGRTVNCIDIIAKYLISLILNALSNKNAQALQLLKALVPRYDSRMISFQRPSFEKTLVQTVINFGKQRINEWLLRPSWLGNSKAFENLALKSGIKNLPSKFENIEGLTGFLKSMGAREATLYDFENALKDGNIPIDAAADIISHVLGLYVAGKIQKTETIAAWRIWMVGTNTLNFSDATSSQAAMRQEFLDMIKEKEGNLYHLKRLLTEMGDHKTASQLIPETELSSRDEIVGTPNISEKINTRSNIEVDENFQLQKWRSAEQQVLQFLKAAGWEISDVSKQNFGYDIEGRNNKGENVYIEVKSINRIGEPFLMTNNEQAVARELGKQYLIALVHQTNNELLVSLIHDPLSKLEMTRQCRQWVWICENYPFEPEKISFKK